MQVRPHLADIDRLWLVYQLMEAVAATHACGVRHGDLKPENVLLTSWNWLLLSDLAPYKPVYLNLEHTADFTYFFDTSGSRRCCIAPERFVRGSAAVMRARAGAHVSASMDTFSLGCIIAELWIGEPLFQYSDMMAFIQDRRMGTQTRVCIRPFPRPFAFRFLLLRACLGSNDLRHLRSEIGMCDKLLTLSGGR